MGHSEGKNDIIVGVAMSKMQLQTRQQKKLALPHCAQGKHIETHSFES